LGDLLKADPMDRPGKREGRLRVRGSAKQMLPCLKLLRADKNGAGARGFPIEVSHLPDIWSGRRSDKP